MTDPTPDRMPIEHTEHDLYFVSDLHLANGYTRRSGRFDPREDFFYDDQFCRFIDHLTHQSRERQRPQRLIMLGDLFEFLQVDNRPYDKHGLPPSDSPAYADNEVQAFLRRDKPFNGLSTSPTATIWRLERIALGHSDWFRALAQFLESGPGQRLDVVVGNHDIEMIWPAAQARFKELVAAAGSDPTLVERIHFYPWFIYEPGLFYAEHGQQYDSFNSFATLLRPTLPPERQPDGTIDWASPGPELIELPLGSFFVRYVFNIVEQRDSFADNVRPMTSYIVWALRNHPIRGLSTFFYQARLLVRVLRKTSSLSELEHDQRRTEYHNTVLTRYAEETGLSAEQLIAIDKLAQIPSMNSRWKQIKQVVIDPLLPLLTLLAPIALIFRALRRMRSTVQALLAFAAGVIALLYRERKVLNPPDEPENTLRDRARDIHKILTEAEQPGARFYIFGHTHQAEIFPLEADSEEPRYLNTGTWTPIIDPSKQLLRGVTQLNFVQILRSNTTYELAELMYWDDGASRPYRVPLIEM